jgi:type IV pilus assembly protein PilA
VINAIRTRMNEDEEGFTLIELLVVVIIIGILAAIAVPTFLNQREKAGNSAQKADLRNAAIAQESVYTESGTYASSTALVDPLQGAFKKTTEVEMWVAASGTTYCMATAHPTSKTWHRQTHADGSPVATAAADSGAAATAAAAACASSTKL